MGTGQTFDKSFKQEAVRLVQTSGKSCLCDKGNSGAREALFLHLSL